MREGWEVKKLGDVCEKTKNINWKENKETIFKYIDLSAVSRETLKITESSKINYSNAPSRAKKSLKTNDVIFATTRPTLNRMTIISSEYDSQICSTGFTVLRAKKDIVEPKYIFYSLQIPSFVQRMEKMQRGASYPAVSDKDVKDFQIPIPPLPKQTQIVKTLDLVFAKLDRAKANLEQNLHNAQELFDSKLNEVFSQRGEGWVEKRLGDVCEKNKNMKWKEHEDKEFKYVDLSSVSRETLQVKETTIINANNAPSRAKKIINTSDVIFATTRPTLKRVTIIKENLNNQICSTGFIVLKAKKDIIYSELIYYFLQTTLFMDRMKALERGASYPAVSDKDVNETIINFPHSLNSQIRIISQLNNFSNISSNLQTHYQQKLNNLEELKKSILEKAFRGELSYEESL